MLQKCIHSLNSVLIINRNKLIFISIAIIPKHGQTFNKWLYYLAHVDYQIYVNPERWHHVSSHNYRRSRLLAVWSLVKVYKCSMMLQDFADEETSLRFPSTWQWFKLPCCHCHCLNFLSGWHDSLNSLVEGRNGSQCFSSHWIDIAIENIFTSNFSLVQCPMMVCMPFAEFFFTPIMTETL